MWTIIFCTVLSFVFGSLLAYFIQQKRLANFKNKILTFEFNDLQQLNSVFNRLYEKNLVLGFCRNGAIHVYSAKFNDSKDYHDWWGMQIASVRSITELKQHLQAVVNKSLKEKEEIENIAGLLED